VENKRDEDGMPLRNVKDLDLYEVSILDRAKRPVYVGTLVSVRSDEQAVMYGETFTDEIQVREIETVPEQPEQAAENTVNYDEADRLIAEIKEE
jgi:hypothetical protein